MVKIITAGRTDTKDLFERGDPFQWERLNHTPFLVFVEEGDTIRVEIVNSKKKLLAYPDATKVMGQWRGEFSSDFFQFTVGELSPVCASGETEANAKRAMATGDKNY